MSYSIGICLAVIAGLIPDVGPHGDAVGGASVWPMYLDIDSMHFGSNGQLQRAEVFLLTWAKVDGWTPVLNPSRLFVRSLSVWRFQQIYSYLEVAV